jgi:CelD/BcsL family acetyltransferase involved in cellulose biosynthesis
MPEYDELIIGASLSNICETPHSSKIMQYTSWQTSSYLTFLNNKFSLKDVLSDLSKNTRYQINRSIKLMGGIENITLTRANNLQQALQYFDEAGEFHKIRWKNKSSGFQNPQFINFHKLFISENFSRGSIDILKIINGDNTLGYLYNFIYDNKAYFYLSGIKYEEDNRLKPGLLSHALAIVKYAQQGCESYDFMGGEGRYKDSFADQKGSMVISNFRRKTIPFLLSNIIRKAKNSTQNLISIP